MSNKRYKRIHGHLKNKTIITQITFLIEAATMFKEFVLKFQAEGPMIHILFAELKEVLLQLLRRFVKPEEVNNITGANLQKWNLNTVDILLPL